MTTSDIRPGDTIGKWTVLSGPIKETRRSAGSTNYVTLFNCRCECGTERPVRAAKLVRNSRSCGCLKVAEFAARATTHGQNRRGGRTRLYRVWDGMHQRCSNESHDSFYLYGGAGVAVCGEWKSFETFAAWAVANGYAGGLEIDRIDGTRGYAPDNCRWVTEAVQQRNKRTVHHVAAFGETKCLTDWSLDPRCPVNPQTIRLRLGRGWDAERAITAPRNSRFDSPKFPGNHVTRPRST